MTTRFGLAVYDLPAPELVEVARAAEACGFDSLWLGEHVVVPREVHSVHPTLVGDAANPLQRSVLTSDTVLNDPWVALGAVAAATTRICLGTGVLVLPLHHPLLVARAVWTLQTLSAGRFLLGVGSGWVAEEFAALDVPFAGRGRQLDGALDVLRSALAGAPVGSPPVRVCAEPVKVPLVLGGCSPAALRRAARVGDGWLSSGAAGIDDVLRGRDLIETKRAALGRAHLPFRCFGRLPSPNPALVDRYVEEGVEDVVAWGDHLWPHGARMSWERKLQHFRTRAEDLGVAPVCAA
jgi:probable F420-dependent oxidoreductase